jgi:D-sedoheptulose 7-phosphate isomerase
MRGEIEAYFHTLGAFGARIEATDRSGVRLSLAAAGAAALEAAQRTRRDRTRVFFIGNGGSAGICSHQATDWLRNGGFAATALNDGATLTCLGNDLGFDQVFAKQIQMHGRAGDLLIAISSSGNSSNILNGVEAARAAGMQVLTLSGFKPDNKLRRLGDVNFYVPSERYGWVEISHLALCHAILDVSMGLSSHAERAAE